MKLGGRLGWAVGLATLVLVILLSVSKLSTARAIAIWLVTLTALTLVALIRHSRESRGPAPASRFEQAFRRPKTKAAQPEELLRMDRELVLGTADADHAHRRLLPLLRTAAAARLAAKYGFELDRRPEAARRLLGDEVWELLRPDRPPPADRHGTGLPRQKVAAVIERLESL